MTSGVPLGHSEGIDLEFKSARALEKPASIAREVVSMMNAQGGEVWIGLAETDGIATREEDIPDAAKRRVGLLNSLLETIEPEPRSEVQVEVVAGTTGASLLLVRVKPNSERGPVALRGESLLFLTRVDQRVRAMTREEIRQRFEGVKSEDSTERGLAARRDAILEQRTSQMWIGIQPTTSEGFDLQAHRVRIHELLTNPAASENRLSGWLFSGASGSPSLNGRCEPKSRWEMRDAAGRVLSIAADGCVEVAMPLSLIENHQRRGSNELHPLAILECAVGLARMAHAAAELWPSAPQRYVADFVFTGTHGWTIPPYAPGTMWDVLHREDMPSLPIADVAARSRMPFTGEQLQDAPDRCGYRIVREIFERFGLTEDRIPSAYDRTAHRLMLRD